MFANRDDSGDVIVITVADIDDGADDDDDGDDDVITMTTMTTVMIMTAIWGYLISRHKSCHLIFH